MRWRSVSIALLAVLALSAVGCNEPQFDPKAGAPPALQVQRTPDAGVFQVEHPERFALAAAGEHSAASQLAATGVVAPDVSRTVPVISLVTGRVVEIRARLGDEVTKGQVLLRVQSPDVSSAFSDYQKAVADEQLTRTQAARAELLYSKSAISQNDLQVAENTEAKAQVDVKTAADKLRVLGNPNLDQPSGIIDIVAPISGYITDQEVTNAAGVQSLGSANPFTISDLSSVWILCDVYEDDLASVRVGQKAEIHLNAFPNRMFTGTIGNIGPVLDPNIRTAKVRIEVRNPGIMRPGMFATVTFFGDKAEKYAAVPAAAVLHLHDRDWVYVPAGGNSFRRVEVKAGDTLDGKDGKTQVILSGLKVGQQVIANALEFENTVEEQ